MTIQENQTQPSAGTEPAVVKYQGPTPGPWEAVPTHYPQENSIQAGNDEIALVYATDGADEPKNFPGAANALLIAAAPSLLAAVKQSAVWLEYAAENDPIGTNLANARLLAAECRAAIAKATGAA